MSNTIVELVPAARVQSFYDELSRSPVVAALLAQLPIGVVIVSHDGRLEYMNAVATALFEAQRALHGRREPWVGPPVTLDDDLEALHWVMARSHLTGEVIRDEEIEYREATGAWRTLSVSATPVRDSVVVSFVDVTASKYVRAWEPLIRSLSRL
jgi:PAS domain-containing protein